MTGIVERAFTSRVVDIGQLSPSDKRELDRAVRQGILSKGRGGPFPSLKTCYAANGFDFKADRDAEITRALCMAVFDL